MMALYALRVIFQRFMVHNSIAEILAGNMQEEEMEQLMRENALLAAFLGPEAGPRTSEEGATTCLTADEKCELATAEVLKAETALRQLRRAHDEEDIAHEAQLGVLEASRAGAVSDLAHLRKRVLEDPNQQTGKLALEHLLKLMEDSHKAKAAAVDQCTAQAASLRVTAPPGLLSVQLS
jgi:hypothetical protein